MKITIYILSFLLVFTACGSSKRVVVKEKTLPSWYTQPLHSTTEDLYALGEGKNKKEAITEALSYMASTLSVSIASTYNAKTVVKEGKSFSKSAEYISDINSNVATMRISHYEVVQEASLGFKRYAVLIHTNKKKLFESMLQEIEQKFFIYEEGEKRVQTRNVFERLAFFKEEKKSFENLHNTLLVMGTLNAEFESRTYIQKEQALEKKYENLLHSISFELVADSNSRVLVPTLTKSLSKKGFRINKSSTLEHFIVYIEANIIKAESYGFTLARSEIKLTTKDAYGIIVGVNSINLVGQSSQGYAIAKQNLSFQLDKLIQKEGIGKLLNLPI